MGLLSSAVRGLRSPGFRQASQYSKKAMEGLMGIGALSGLGYTAHQDLNTDADIGAGDYLSNAVLGAGLPLGLGIEGASLLALGPNATVYWNRELYDAMKRYSARRQIERERREDVAAKRRRA